MQNRSEFRSVSAKMPVEEITQFKAFCEKKGVSPSALLRQIALKEMGITIPAKTAGNNIIEYEKKTDTFSWSIITDDETIYRLGAGISAEYIEELFKKLRLAIEERNSSIGKHKDDSVPVDDVFLR